MTLVLLRKGIPADRIRLTDRLFVRNFSAACALGDRSDIQSLAVAVGAQPHEHGGPQIADPTIDGFSAACALGGIAALEKGRQAKA
jgi:hypothetical protein